MKLLVAPLLLFLVVPLWGDDAASLEELLADLSHSNRQIRRQAILAAEGRTEPELINRILALAKSDSDSNMRGYAAGVLASFSDKRIFPVLSQMAQGEEYGVRIHAYVALGKLGDPRGKPILLAGLTSGRGIRGYAAKGLGLLGDAAGFEPVARLLLEHTSDPYVAELAPAALERMDTPAALTFLRKHFTALPGHALGFAARVLGRNPNQETRVMMMGMLNQKNRALRLAAIQVLTGLQDKKATRALLAHFARDEQDRAPVVLALGAIDDARAVAPLIAALRVEKDLLVKVRLIEALGRLGDKAALDVLMPLLDDTTLLKQSPRISAARAFPWNTRVHGVATWAILTIQNGAEPFPVTDLSSFPRGDPPERIAHDIATIRKRAAK